MIFQLEIQDDDAKWLFEQTNSYGFTVDRRNDVECAICRRLQDAGIIEQLEYYGESICYNPSYRPTGLGKKVIAQYKAMINGNT